MLPSKPITEKPAKLRKYKLRLTSQEEDNSIFNCVIIDTLQTDDNKKEIIKDSIPKTDIRFNTQSSINNCSWCKRVFTSVPYREFWCDVTCCGLDSACSRCNK